MIYRVTFTTEDEAAIERLRQINGTRIDSLYVAPESTITRQTDLVSGETQTERLEALLSDGLAHRTDEILRRVYHVSDKGIARIGARIADLKKKNLGKAVIEGWKDANNHKLYWYVMRPLAARIPASVS